MIQYAILNDTLLYCFRKESKYCNSISSNENKCHNTLDFNSFS